MNKMINIQKGAAREQARKAGAYDGRFGHRVETDRYKERQRTLCREDVEVPGEGQEPKGIELSSHRL